MNAPSPFLMQKINPATRDPIRRGPSLAADVMCIVLGQGIYEFKLEDGDWALVSPSEFERLKSTGESHVPHDASVDLWCQIAADGKPFFERLNVDDMGAAVTAHRSLLAFFASSSWESPSVVPALQSLIDSDSLSSQAYACAAACSWCAAGVVAAKALAVPLIHSIARLRCDGFSPLLQRNVYWCAWALAEDLTSSHPIDAGGVLPELFTSSIVGDDDDLLAAALDGLCASITTLQRRSTLIKAGLLPLLLQPLKRRDNRTVYLSALSVCSRMCDRSNSFEENPHQKEIVASGVLPLVVVAFEGAADADIQGAASQVLWYLTRNAKDELVAAGILALKTKLLAESSDINVLKNILFSIRNYFRSKKAHADLFLQLGTLPVIIALLNHESPDIQEKASIAITEFTRTSDAMEIVLDDEHYLRHEAGFRILAHALLMKPRTITRFSFSRAPIGSAGASWICPALAHLTSLTKLCLVRTDLESSGVSHLTSALTHLTVLTELDLSSNNLTGNDGARICGAAAAAGMTRLLILKVDDNLRCCDFDLINALHRQRIIIWRSVAAATGPLISPPSLSLPGFKWSASEHAAVPFSVLTRILLGIDSSIDIINTRAAPEPEVIYSNSQGGCGPEGSGCTTVLPLPGLTAADVPFLSHLLSFNTCITDLQLIHNNIGSAAVELIESLTHLTSLTSLKIDDALITADIAADILKTACRARLTHISKLELACHPVVTTIMHNYGDLSEWPGTYEIHEISSSSTFFASDVLQSATWLQLQLPQPPDEIVSAGYGAILQYMFSTDKVSVHELRIFVVGESTAGKTSLVRALMSPSSKCDSIDLADRTIGIDCYDLQLLPTSITPAPTISLRLWDLAGQDVYTLSHSVHFSHRCLYMLLWKPDTSVHSVMQRVSPWLESLCMHVPDAHILLVASHCKTNIRDDEFLALSGLVEDAARSKVQELNSITLLEVDELRTLLVEAEQNASQLMADYLSHTNSKPEIAQAERDFKRLHHLISDPHENFSIRASATDALPRSLRIRASSICDALVRVRLLCERLQLLLGIRDGGRPDQRDACKLTLHCRSTDSVKGHGVTELRGWMYDHCRSLPFMGEMIPLHWISVSDIFRHFGDSVLSRSQAIALVRQRLPPSTAPVMNDDALWNVIVFWSLVGRIFVYESQVVRDPRTLIALLKPLVHHEPLQMMIRHHLTPSDEQMLDSDTFTNSAASRRLESLLRSLQESDELSLELLLFFKAWRNLSLDQRTSILSFFERSRLLCRVKQCSELRLVTSRVRSKPHLTQLVEEVTGNSLYHALYLLPLNHIGIIARLQSAVTSINLQHMNIENQSGRDSLVIRRFDDPSCAFALSVEEFAACVQHHPRFKRLCGHLGRQYSSVLRIAATDFGMFKFASTVADTAMATGNFGTRFQCWVSLTPSLTSATTAKWTLFCGLASSPINQQQIQQQQLSSSLSLSCALQLNHHEQVVSGQSILRMFKPRSSIFVSHAWGDGTSEFIKRLKTHLEQQTLSSVWVDQDGLNQQQEVLIPAFRDALCQARIVFVVLTPSYLTRPNCLRELRWALDFERAGHLRVVLLSLHPAVTFDGRLQLVQDGPLKGLVFSSKEKKVKRLCPDAIALVKRLNDVHMNHLPWHELQAWRSDAFKDDWEEHRGYVQGGVSKTVRLAGDSCGLVEETLQVVKDWIVCAAPRPSSECAPMDDTDTLTASDVANSDVACSVMDLTRYPEEAAADYKNQIQNSMQQAIMHTSPALLPQPPVSSAPILLPFNDLRRVPAQELADEIAAISPDYAGYHALFLSAGFDGELLCDVVDDADLQQLVDSLGIANGIHRRRVLARLRVFRARYQQPPGP